MEKAMAGRHFYKMNEGWERGHFRLVCGLRGPHVEDEEESLAVRSSYPSWRQKCANGVEAYITNIRK